MLGVFEKLDVALHDFGKWNVPPPPETGRGRASNPGNGCSVPLMLDGDALLLLNGKRQGAVQTVAFTRYQCAGCGCRVGLSFLKLRSETLGKLLLVRSAQGGY